MYSIILGFALIYFVALIWGSVVPVGNLKKDCLEEIVESTAQTKSVVITIWYTLLQKAIP